MAKAKVATKANKNVTELRTLTKGYDFASKQGKTCKLVIFEGVAYAKEYGLKNLGLMPSKGQAHKLMYTKGTDTVDKVFDFTKAVAYIAPLEEVELPDGKESDFRNGVKGMIISNAKQFSDGAISEDVYNANNALYTKLISQI